MRKGLVMAALLAGMVMADLACAAEGGASRSFPVGNFDRVALSASPDVIVSVGGPVSVTAEGDPVGVERLDIHVEDGTLRIGTRRDGWNKGWRGRVLVRVQVPSLAGASVSGSGNMRVDRVEAANFAGSAGGSGNLDIGMLRTDSGKLSVSGSGGLRAAGQANSLTLMVSGSGGANLDALDARNAVMTVSGSGSAKLRSAEEVNVTVSGSGDAVIGGNPRCRVKSTGSGSLRCGA